MQWKNDFEITHDVGWSTFRSKNGLNSTTPFSASFFAGWILYLKWIWNRD